MSSNAFWDITPDSTPAFIDHDGSVISYHQLKQDVDTFSERLSDGRGLITIRCAGNYHQYVAYLSALQQKCPVILVADNSAYHCQFSVRYTYDSANDLLTIDHDITPPLLHDDLALLLSTSGSTGAAKSVKLSYKNLEANAQSIVDYLQLDDGERAPMALPFYYSYGLSVVNSHLQARATIVLIKGSVVDEGFWHTFRRESCTSLAGVPHSFELMEQNQAETADLPALRYMTQAGGKLAPAKVKAWCKRASQEGWRFVVMYGQTEASPRISYLPPEMAYENPECIGKAIPGGHLSLINDQDKAIEDGQPGELVYKGANVMMGYAESDTDLASQAGEPILHTGDIAIRHSNGLYEIVGRKSRFVKLYGYRISLDSIEKKLSNEGLEVACSAKGEQLYILLTDNTVANKSLSDIKQQLVDWLNIPNSAFHLFTLAELPRKTNGKIDNQAIKHLIDTLETSQTKAPSKGWLTKGKSLLGLETPLSVLDIFKNNFPNQKVSSTSSFKSLGGDSLIFMSVAMELESLLGNLPDDWGNMSIQALQEGSKAGSFWASIDSISLFRCLSICIIVIAHLTAFSYSPGGAYILFFIAGWTLAGFTLPNVLQAQSAKPVLILAIRLGILTIAIQLVNKVLTGWGHWSSFLLISNWVSPEAGGAWFLEVYIQLLLVFAALLCIPPIRHLLSKNPFMVLFSSTLLLTLVAAGSDQLIDTHHLFRRLPHILAWMLLVGATLYYADSVCKRLLLSLAFLFGCFQFHSYHLPLDYLLIVGFVLLWVPNIPLFKFLLKPIRLIAGASLMIYLTHFALGSITHKLFPGNDILAVAIALVGGITLWHLYSPIDKGLRERLNRNKSVES